MRLAGGLLLAVLCAALVACGGPKEADKRVAPPGDRERAAAIASVERLATSVRAADARSACRALSLATRRVVALVGDPGATCPSALEEFLVVHGLRRALPAARELTATVSGARAAVRGTGLPGPLTASRNAGGWRVTLVGLPGVRGDVLAARACGRYVAKADALGLPPFRPSSLGDRLRSEARLVDGLRRRLSALPTDGPARLGLPDVVRALAAIRTGLRLQARRVDDGAPVERAMQSTARADRLVRALLADEASKARVACPLDVTKGPELAARRTVLDAACRDYGEAIGMLDRAPETPGEARAALRGVDRALARLDRGLRRAPVAARLRSLRAATRRAVASMRASVAALGTSGSDAGFEEARRRVEGYGAQIDTALIRLGATCLDGQRTPPRATPPPRRARAPGTVES